jgi:acetyl esterase/lipase
VRTNLHPVTEQDRTRVADLLASVRGATDSGAAVFKLLDPSAVRFETQLWRAGESAGESVGEPAGDSIGEWVRAPGAEGAEGADGSGIVLYLHGRRFQHDEPPSVYAAALSAATGLPVLHARYRLAPAHPYPAALEDVLAAYEALLEQGHPADGIALVGHSAGATLALSALLRLREGALPMPACTVALSPITDFTFSGETLADNAERDVLAIDEFRQVRSAYLGPADPAGAPQSPLFGDFSGLPPLLVTCGEAEMLRADGTRFAERAAAAGTDVTVHVYELMPHGFPVLPFDASADLSRRVGAFIRDRLAAVAPAAG